MLLRLTKSMASTVPTGRKRPLPRTSRHASADEDGDVQFVACCYWSLFDAIRTQRSMISSMLGVGGAIITQGLSSCGPNSE